VIALTGNTRHGEISLSQPFVFPSPEPFRERARIYPIFLPFSGCPQRCLFCSQEAQTGRGQQSVAEARRRAAADLSRRAQARRGGEAAPKPFELAFYGGTFTALSPEDRAACLDFAAAWRARGMVDKTRCSTRPDAVDPALLAELRQGGCTCVELGVQSFSDTALRSVRRGYTGKEAERACRLAQEAGLALGVQLLPGLPGHTRADAEADIERCLAIGPDMVRLYPCLTLEGTGLAELWRRGEYRPWALEPTLDFLAFACRRLGAAGIPVIRMGLAEELGLAGQILAGPRHPDMGGLVRGRALYAHIAEHLARFRAEAPGLSGAAAGAPQACGDAPAREPSGVSGAAGRAPAAWEAQGGAFSLFLPAPLQGMFWGHGGELAPAYAALGIKKNTVVWWRNRYCMLQWNRLGDV
jgi:histone acetyltransferase (RNA polymerase elongator complex component)